MYKFYCDTFQMSLAGQCRSFTPEDGVRTEEEAAAVTLGARDARSTSAELRTKAEVEAEVRRLLGQVDGDEAKS